MLILFTFAFLAGLFTALSPCILPVLPAILAVGVTKERLRPFGAILGLVISFSFFTLALSWIVHVTGISPNILRYVAIALIAFFGLVMLFPRLSNWFAKVTAPVATLGQKLQEKQRSGFWGGIVFGIALGLLWTPCAGPILAAITTLVATHSINITAVLMTLFYSIGAGIPMFILAYGSAKIINASHFLSRYLERIRQFFGVLMLLFAILLFFNWEIVLTEKLSRYVPEVFSEKHLVDKELIRPKGELLSMDEKAPQLTGITGWINSSPLTLDQLKGKVVLIDFWTYSCINCLRTLPYLNNWYRDYKNYGLIIIGVHTPEFAFEKDYNNVQQAVERLKIEYPVALDNNYSTWNAYHNHYWPAHYLIDKKGNIRMVHYGEGGYKETEEAIRMLLGLPKIEGKEKKKVFRSITAETYLGFERGHSYAMEIKNNQTMDYHYSLPLENDQIGLKGLWQVENEYILAQSDNSYLDGNFLATHIYLVLSGSSDIPLKVVLDGRPYKKIPIDGDKEYEIISAPYKRHLVSIKIPKGIKAYVFTFGSK